MRIPELITVRELQEGLATEDPRWELNIQKEQLVQWANMSPKSWLHALVGHDSAHQWADTNPRTTMVPQIEGYYQPQLCQPPGKHQLCNTLGLSVKQLQDPAPPSSGPTPASRHLGPSSQRP